MIGPNTDEKGKKLPHILSDGEGDLVVQAQKHAMQRFMNAAQSGDLAQAVDAMKVFMDLIDRD